MPLTRAQLRAEKNTQLLNRDDLSESGSEAEEVSMTISKKSKTTKTTKTGKKRAAAQTEKPPPRKRVKEESIEKDGESYQVVGNAGGIDTSGKLQIGLALLQSAMTQMIGDSIREEVGKVARRGTGGAAGYGRFNKLLNPRKRRAGREPEIIIEEADSELESDFETIASGDEIATDDEEELENTQHRDELEARIDELFALEEEDGDEEIHERVSEEQAKEMVASIEQIQKYRRERFPDIVKILSTKMSMDDKSKILDWFMMYNFSTEPHSEERIALRNLIHDYMRTNALNDSEDLEKIEAAEERYRKVVDSKQSIRQRIHSLNTTEENKAIIFEMFLDTIKTPQGHEDYEDKRNRLETILEFPFGVIRPLPVQIGRDSPEKIADFLADVRQKLDANILYMDDVKDQIMTYVSACILNPDQSPSPIAIEGSPGVGKTTLVMKGVAEALGLPFFHLNGGGISDIHEVRGSDKVYRSSGPGLLFKYAIEAKCLNFVFYFDEADKTSNRSNEVLSYMVHFFDNTSNTQIQDGYFKGISFDFSKCLKFVSYNSRHELGDVFGDRIQKFVIPDYTHKQRLDILERILVPRYLAQAKLQDKVRFTSEACQRILSKQLIQEAGLRQTCRNVENLVKIVGMIYVTGTKNMSRIVKGIKVDRLKTLFSDRDNTDPIELSAEVVEILWREPATQSAPMNMYN